MLKRKSKKCEGGNLEWLGFGRMFFSGSEIKARAVKKETKIMETVVSKVGWKLVTWEEEEIREKTER